MFKDEGKCGLAPLSLKRSKVASCWCSKDTRPFILGAKQNVFVCIKNALDLSKIIHTTKHKRAKEPRRELCTALLLRQTHNKGRLAVLLAIKSKTKSFFVVVGI